MTAENVAEPFLLRLHLGVVIFTDSGSFENVTSRQSSQPE